MFSLPWTWILFYFFKCKCPWRRNARDSVKEFNSGTRTLVSGLRSAICGLSGFWLVTWILWASDSSSVRCFPCGTERVRLHEHDIPPTGLDTTRWCLLLQAGVILLSWALFLHLTVPHHQKPWKLYLGEWGEISHSLEDCLPGLSNSEVI